MGGKRELAPTRSGAARTRAAQQHRTAEEHTEVEATPVHARKAWKILRRKRRKPRIWEATMAPTIAKLTCCDQKATSTSRPSRFRRNTWKKRLRGFGFGKEAWRNEER